MKRRASAAALLVATAIVLLVLFRIDVQPMQPYGDGAAQYIEHAMRLEVAQAARDWTGPVPELLAAADAHVLSHPPGLHLITGTTFGTRAEDVLWTGVLWLLLLASSVGVVAGVLARSRRAAVLAAVGTMLLPAAHASATRYHYDLPMTALIWASVAALALGLDRGRVRGVVGGLASGVLLAGACLVKWTALTFGPPMLLALLLERWTSRLARPAPAARALAAAGAIATSATLLALWLAGSDQSFGATNLAMGDLPLDPTLHDLLGERLAGLFAAAGHHLTLLDARRLAWYPTAAVVGVFSPLWLAALLPGLLAWVRTERRGARLLAGAALAHGAVLLLLVLRPDERFLLTVAPCLIVVAAIGFDAVPRHLALAAGIGLAVAIEFHVPDRVPWREHTLLAAGSEAQPGLQWMGPFLTDSFEQRGWARRAATGDDRARLREELWEQLVVCDESLLAVRGSVSARGDAWWMRYRSDLSEFEGPARDVLPLNAGRIGSFWFWWPNPDAIRDDRVLERAGFSWDRLPPGEIAWSQLPELDIERRALNRYQPRLGLAVPPLDDDDPLSAPGWHELRRFETEGEPLALYGLPGSCDEGR